MASKRPDLGTLPKSAKADPEQFQRFLEAAHELGCEESFERFEEALPRILRAPPSHAKPKAERRKKAPSAE